MIKKILCILGTRPEAIKLSPLISILKNHPRFDLAVCVTGQHQEMLRQVLTLFEIEPDFDLEVMKPDQNLSDLTGKILSGISKVIQEFQPDCVLVHGDTTTTLAASLAAFYHKVDVGHVEAGLRTYDIYSPWPEEINRQCVGRISRFHFAPTISSKENLISEGISADKIFVTGNTVIDALQQISNALNQDSRQDLFKRKFDFIDEGKKLLLVTGHRRENFGKAFENVCRALRDIALSKDIQIIYPVHLNPHIQSCALKILSGIPNVYLIDPLDYESFVYLIGKAYLIVTDSGGIQEEAPALGKPVLVTRETTERPEAVESGTAILVGTDQQKIISQINILLEDQNVYSKMAKAKNPYGDGTASQQICDILITEIFKG